MRLTRLPNITIGIILLTTSSSKSVPQNLNESALLFVEGTERPAYTSFFMQGEALVQARLCFFVVFLSCLVFESVLFDFELILWTLFWMGNSPKCLVLYVIQ